MRPILELLAEASALEEPFALGLISRVQGSSPQKRGAKALFFPDGRIVGTLGGGCLEAEIQDRARRALRTGEPATFDLVLDHDFGWDDGLICGGRVSGLILPNAASARDVWALAVRRDEARTWGVRSDYTIGFKAPEDPGPWLYEEAVPVRCGLWIAGSGHVAQAVAPLAASLDFDVTVWDDRSTFASGQYFPESTAFRIGPWNELLETPLGGRPVFGLIVTRGHQRDAWVLSHWLRRSFVFLGMIGSRRKKRLIFEQFLADGLATREQLERVSCPVGLPIQSVSVPEIAISIAAELVQVRAGRVLGMAPRESVEASGKER